MKYLVLIVAVLVVQMYCRQVSHKAKDVNQKQKGLVVPQKSEHSKVKVNSVTKRLLKSVVAVQAKKQGNKEKVVSKLQKISKARTSQRLKHKKKGTKDVVLASDICVTAVKGGVQTWMPYLKEDLHGIQTLTLKWKSGMVSCKAGGDSKFGCLDDGFMMMATKNQKKVMFPDLTKEGPFKAVGTEQLYKVAEKGSGETFTVYISDTTILATDLIMFWYTESYYKTYEDDNSGTTCFDVTAQVDDSVEQGNKEQLATQVGSNICMKATGTVGVDLTIPKDIKYVQAIQFNHRSGKVSCNGESGGVSNFGCLPYGYSTLLMKGGQVVAPTTFDTAFKENSQTDGKLLTYKVNGEADSETFQLKLDETKTTFLTTDKYSVIYSEVAWQSTVSDNWGESCMDVFILSDLAKLTAEEAAAAAKAAEEAAAVAAKKTEEEAAAAKLKAEADAKLKTDADAKKKLDDEAAAKVAEAAKLTSGDAAVSKTDLDCRK